jgi:NhaC family Na+:H+ antiporter
MSTATTQRTPSFLQAILCFLLIITTIAVGLFAFGIDLHSLMFLCLVWASLNARLLGHSFTAIRSLMSAAITRALPAIYIFILIGMVIASFMHSGTIATLMYFGLDWLSPGSFLAVGMLLCALLLSGPPGGWCLSWLRPLQLWAASCWKIWLPRVPGYKPQASMPASFWLS